MYLLYHKIFYLSRGFSHFFTKWLWAIFQKIRGLESDSTGFEPIPFMACRGFPFSPLDNYYYSRSPFPLQEFFYFSCLEYLNIFWKLSENCAAGVRGCP